VRLRPHATGDKSVAATSEIEVGNACGERGDAADPQELLQMIANTVVRVDQLWVTSLERTDDTFCATKTAAEYRRLPIAVPG
jgi:hypothetical protein